MITKPAATDVIEQTMVAHARATVQKMTDKDVLESLKAQGITSLEDLVSKSLAGVKTAPSGGGIVARDTFIYTQAIYKTAMPVDQNLINELTKAIGH